LGRKNALLLFNRLFMNRLFAALLFCVSVRAQPISFVCAPSTPIAAPGAAIRLNAWASGGTGAKLVYAWTVSSGEVRPAGPNSFTWKLAARSSEIQTADGELRVGSIVQARCLVEVQVEAESAASTGTQEPGDAGLYSYLLLSEPPKSQNQELLKAIIHTWLTLNGPIDQLRRSRKPGESIALMIPVRDQPANPPDAAWVLEHYDFPRAQTLLAKASPSSRSGIFIVSSLSPLAKSRAPYLFQNLSAASPSLASSWVEAFINLAAQEHSWTPSSEASLLDQIRAVVSALGGSMKWTSLL
jgi:hypothetical protein